jgi:hypothetical protein
MVVSFHVQALDFDDAREIALKIIEDGVSEQYEESGNIHFIEEDVNWQDPDVDNYVDLDEDEDRD